MAWQPAHLRAHKNETTEQRNLRRGNDAADFYANMGRRLHDPIENASTTLAVTVSVSLSCRCRRTKKADVIQAVAASLPGPIQTTPRAELYVILIALVYGISPQLIVCDHWDHVKALIDLSAGIASMLNPMTPNLDLWRQVIEAVAGSGGLCREGANQL